MYTSKRCQHTVMQCLTEENVSASETYRRSKMCMAQSVRHTDRYSDGVGVFLEEAVLTIGYGMVKRMYSSFTTKITTPSAIQYRSA